MFFRGVVLWIFYVWIIFHCAQEKRNNTVIKKSEMWINVVLYFYPHQILTYWNKLICELLILACGFRRCVQNRPAFLFQAFFSSLPKYRPALLNGHLKSSGGLSDGLIWSSAWLCLLWESVVKVSQRFSTSWLMQSRVHFWFSQADCVMLELQRTTLACAWLGYHGYSFSPPPVSETFGRWTNRPSCKRDSELAFPISWMTKYHLIITM